MTKHTAGILGSLTPAALRALTDAELDAKVTALEATSDGDGFLSTADEADLTLLHREQARREDVAAQPPTWFLATIRYRVVPGSMITPINNPVLVLVEARDGAAVEEVLRRHGYERPDASVSWLPLADAPSESHGSPLVVIPAVPR